MYLLKKLLKASSWKKLMLDRLTEPLHLNLLSLFVLVFGTFRQKVSFDLIVRPQYAYGILKAADVAKKNGIHKMTLVELGVGSGAGLMNMIKIGEKVRKMTGVDFHIVGFDTGEGMPEAKDFRDHPDLYSKGDFPMDRKRLQKEISGKAMLHLGSLQTTLPPFLKSLSPENPIGFIVIDVDYYSSTKDSLVLFQSSANHYLPITYVYLDDIELEPHNSLCGELRAVREFNAAQKERVIERDAFFENRRLFRNATWLKHMYQFHLLDHPARREITPYGKRILENPYL